MRSNMFWSLSTWLTTRASPERAEMAAGDAGSLDWMATARDAPAFVLDACFSAPAHVPGWLLKEGARNAPAVDSLPLPTRGGFVAAGVALGNEAMLVAHYRRILAAAPPPAARRTDLTPFQCFEVDVALSFAAEEPLHIDMFGGSARAAAALLAKLADPAMPDGTLYDNLDQGWALRIVATPRHLFTLEWDWDRQAAEDTPRALRFERVAMAAQAREALPRLQSVHAALVRGIGADLWNVRRIAERSGRQA